MFVEKKTITVKSGFADNIIEKFSRPSKIQEMDGFVDLSVMKRVRKGKDEEVVIQIRWENQEAFINWKKSDVHKAGHTNKSKQRAEYIIDVSVDMYSIESVKSATN